VIWHILLLLLAQAYWQSKPPSEWNDLELARFLADSPWAQMAMPAAKAGSVPPVPVYIATAGPIEKAVAERARRIALRRPGAKAEDLLGEEFAAWFADHRTDHVILAARVGNNNAFTSEPEMRRMQQDCALDLGRVKVKMSGYFPPTSRDPYLYLAFPRLPVTAADKSVGFDLYLPGVPGPFRRVEFKTRDMLLDGKLEW
jgi:hypothetical protein